MSIKTHSHVTTNPGFCGKEENTHHANLVTVIMPCYNDESFVGEAIMSVLAQTHPEIELVIVDDGSTDRSLVITSEFQKKYPARIKLLRQDQQGPYVARNLGITHATGEFIAFLDADDWWSEDFLGKMHAALMENSNAALAYCGWQNLGTHSSGNDPYIPPRYENGDLVATFLKSCPWPIHAALIRKKVIHAVHGFSERLPTSMDYDLWLRIMANNKKMVCVPEVMAFYRWHGQQISSNHSKQVLNSVQVRKDFVAQYPHLVRHLPKDKLHELTDGYLLRKAYQAYWNRDLDTASALFRQALRRGIWRLPDLRYIIPSLLPKRVLHFIVSMADQFR